MLILNFILFFSNRERKAAAKSAARAAASSTIADTENTVPKSEVRIYKSS